MAISLTKRDNRNIDNNICEFTVDYASDVSNLPTEITPGSTAFVIETSSVYMLNNQKQWKEL